MRKKHERRYMRKAYFYEKNESMIDGSRLHIIKKVQNHPFLNHSPSYWKNWNGMMDYLTDTMFICPGIKYLSELTGAPIEDLTVRILNHEFMHMLLYHLEGVKTARHYDNLSKKITILIDDVANPSSSNI